MAGAALPRSDFYVYVLFRHDSGEPFYVGKGSGERWITSIKGSRNKHKKAIFQKAKEDGATIPVVRVAVGLTEAEAFALECSFIAAIGREPNGPLTNATDGGEGCVGRIGWKHSPETRAKISASHTGQTRSDETRAKLRARKLPPVTQATKDKLRAILTGRIVSEETRAKKRGKVTSPETRETIRKSNTGHVVSPETRKKIGEKSRGYVHTKEARKKMSISRKGKKHSPEHIANQVASRLRTVYRDRGL